ncbi:MAG: O-antigen ligase family protein [Candidatus Acidiferrales bacterium]
MRAIRVGVCMLAAFAVLAFGTVEIWSESILEAGAAALFLWWAILLFRRRDIEIYWNPIFWPVLAFTGIASVQLAFGVTAYPFLTRVALLKVLACALLFFLSVQSFRTRQDLRFVAWFLMSFGFAVAVLGIAQNYTSHDVLYWFRPLTEGGSPFGPYVNRDHFAGFMELIVPVGMSLMVLRGVPREQMMFTGILTLVPIVALVLTGSRGGSVSLVFEIGLLAALMRVRKARFQGAAVAAILLVSLAALMWLGAGKVLDRIKASSVADLSADRRVTMLKGAWHMFLDHPLLGTGLGTLVAVYPKYETFYDGRIVDHVHDDYAEALAETGIAGGLCGLVFLVMLFREARRRLLTEEQSAFSQAVHTAGTVACAGLLVHSLVDFNLHIPANGLVFLLQAAVVLSPTFNRRKRALIT